MRTERVGTFVDRIGECTACGELMSRHFDEHNRFRGCVMPEAHTDQKAEPDVHGYLVQYFDRAGLLTHDAWFCDSCFPRQSVTPGRLPGGRNCEVHQTTEPKRRCRICGTREEI